MYGQKQRTEMNDLPYDKNLLQNLQSESELEKLLGCASILGEESEEEEDNENEFMEESDDEDDHIVTIPGLHAQVIVQPPPTVTVINLVNEDHDNNGLQDNENRNEDFENIEKFGKELLFNSLYFLLNFLLTFCIF